SPGPSGAKATASETSRVVLKGEIVDLACYLMHEGRGDTHGACAQACGKGGGPAGLLWEGVLYGLFAPRGGTGPFAEGGRRRGGGAPGRKERRRCGSRPRPRRHARARGHDGRRQVLRERVRGIRAGRRVPTAGAACHLDQATPFLAADPAREDGSRSVRL